MMENGQDLISVIVPVYNTKKYLERCVNSILAQTWKNLEILLVDDGSTDGTGELADALGKEDGRIRVLHKENGGSSSARNLGIRSAHGTYLGFIDSDDYIEPFMYEKLYEALKASHMPIAQGARDEIDEQGKLLPDICVPPKEMTVYSSKEFMRELLLHKGDCSFCTKLMDAKLLRPEGESDTFVERLNAEVTEDRGEPQPRIKQADAEFMRDKESRMFPEGKLNEDFYLLVQLLSEIEGIVSIPERVYHVFYRTGSNTRLESRESFSRVFSDIVDNADMVTELVRKEYPDLISTALRFGLYQRLDYLLHIPISQMTKENRQYCEIIKYLKRNRKEIRRNPELTKKQKVYLLLFSVAPVLIRKVHRRLRQEECIKK